VDTDDLRREINKLRHELEEEKKEIIKLEVQLDNERERHEKDLEELKVCGATEQ
jgi:molecular chaperone GrpE (heat shock protein)